MNKKKSYCTKINISNIYFFLILFCTSTFNKLLAQQLFGDLSTGHWSGQMYLYNQGKMNDSIFVNLEIDKLETSNTWKWKTSYDATPKKIIKDYFLKSIDPDRGFYLLDEGDGIELNCYQFNNKLYSTFEVNGKILTATYELIDDALYFEVTSGKKENTTGEGSVLNYSVEHIQKVVFHRN